MISFRNISKYKYELTEDFTIALDELKTAVILFGNPQSWDFIAIDNGIMTIKKGYQFDGPSGPTIDTTSFMRGALVHDAFYQLIRGESFEKKWRRKADKILYRLCREDGMSWFRAKYVYHAVRSFGGKFV